MVMLGSDFADHGRSLKESMWSQSRGGGAQASLSNGLLINLHHKIIAKILHTVDRKRTYDN